MKRVLVTGGCGFIGSYVVEELHRLDIDVVAFDRYLHHAERNEDVFFGDVRNQGALAQALYGCDGFIHLAGVLGTQETVQDPTTAAEVNIFGSLNLFKAARTYEIPGVYIAVGNHWMNNPYSITKTTAERFAFMANKEWDTHIAVVRALNAYGPRQKHEPVRKLMPNLIRTALKGEYFPIYGDGRQIMDMIFVEDLAKILVKALIMDHKSYDAPFEAGTGVATTVNQIAEEVYRQVGRREPLLTYEPMRPGEAEDAVVLGNPDTLRFLDVYARDLLRLRDGVARTVPWYRERL